MKGRKVGLHLRISDTISSMAFQARELGLDIVQTFFADPLTGLVMKLAGADRAEFTTVWRPQFEAIYLHCSYRINFSSTQYQDHPVFERELQLAKKCRCTHLILHPGSADKQKSRQEGIASLAVFLNALLQRERYLSVVLENTVGGVQTIGTTFDDFIALYPLLDEPRRISLCLDTAHAHVSGYDLSTDAGQAVLCDQIEKVQRYFAISLIHVNDTPQPVGSGLDQHALPGTGLIGAAMLKKLVNHPLLSSIPLIIEPPVNSSLQEQVAALLLVRSW